ncbi:MAG: SDR family NAD(P)-dependent oxidoreductase [Hyphomicrobiales bacterium]|nr:SDR family NAD(P)-dependent oxidoreductase [Hyphomicrobiales bacterium]
MSKPLENRVAVVTGASRGIGYAIARQLAAEGAHVIALARTVGGLEELDDEIKAAGGSATLVPMNVCDYAATDRLGAVIHERWGKLDVLVGNAGVLGKLTPVGHLEPKVWDEVMAVNVTANWRLIRSLDPLLQQSDAGRALFVSAGAIHKGIAYWGAYSASKAALEALVKTYATETATTNVRVNLLNPGPIRTAMRARAMPGEDPKTLPAPADLARTATSLCLPDCAQSGAIFDFQDGTLTAR